MSTQKQKNANRRNAKKSSGPHDTSVSRLNAIRHGLLANGLTQLDDGEAYAAVLAELMVQKEPVGPTENFLVTYLALIHTKWVTCLRLAAEHVTSALHPPLRDPKDPLKDLFPEPRILHPGVPARLPFGVIEQLVHTFDRYEKELSNRYFRVRHELDRMQRERRGEHVPPPIVADVCLHTTPSSSEPVDQVPSPGNVENSLGVPVPDATPNVAAPAPMESENISVCRSNGVGSLDHKTCHSAGSDEANEEKKEALPDAPWRKQQPRPLWSC